MTAAARKIDRVGNTNSSAAARPSPLAAFELRSWARAYLWSVGEFDLHEAVDVLQHAAERDGLIATPGQDRVQLILRDAFHAVRGGQ